GARRPRRRRVRGGGRVGRIDALRPGHARDLRPDHGRDRRGRPGRRRPSRGARRMSGGLDAHGATVAPGAPVLRIDGVSKVYPGSPPTVALSDITLDVHAGELVAIV